MASSADQRDQRQNQKRGQRLDVPERSLPLFRLRLHHETLVLPR